MTPHTHVSKILRLSCDRHNNAHSQRSRLETVIQTRWRTSKNPTVWELCQGRQRRPRQGRARHRPQTRPPDKASGTLCRVDFFFLTPYPANEVWPFYRTNKLTNTRRAHRYQGRARIREKLTTERKLTGYRRHSQVKNEIATF